MAVKSRRRSAAARATVRETAATDHPTHIVLFRQASEANEQVVAKALKVRPMTTARSALGIHELGAPGTPAHASVYPQLGVAAVSASQTELARIEADPSVEEVFVNEERHIPDPAADASIEQGSLAGSRGLDYLLGLREGIDTALAALTGRREPPTVPTRRPEGAGAITRSMTWGLGAVGIAHGYAYTGRGATVAVLDTGIDLQHPDLQGRVQEGTTARSFVPGQGVQDGNRHGTHCCGTVAGPLISVGGVRYGIAPDVSLLVGKVLSDAGSGWDNQIIDGIQWAASEGANVISMSLGSVRQDNGPYSRLYERVAERLLEGSPGTLLVAAAGNGSRRPLFTMPVENPAACPSILAVAAVDESMAIAAFSCRQMDGIGAVEVSGPGVSVYSSVPGGRFEYLSGTSMATPHVAGVAALYIEANPKIAASELWDRLVADARPLGDHADFGSGMVRAPATGGT